MVFNATFNNISVTSRRSVLYMEKTGVTCCKSHGDLFLFSSSFPQCFSLSINVTCYVFCCFLAFCSPSSLDLVLRWLLVYLFCSSIVINAVIVTAGTFEPLWKREVWRRKILFNPPFLWKCLYQVRVITVFPVFRLLTDFVCLYTYEFWLSLWKIVRSSVILLLPLFIETDEWI